MNQSAQTHPRSLPERPNLRHLKDQAKDLLKVGQASSLAEAQLQIARQYGFPSWPKLKRHVESRDARGSSCHFHARKIVNRVAATLDEFKDAIEPSVTPRNAKSDSRLETKFDQANDIGQIRSFKILVVRYVEEDRVFGDGWQH